jgi:Zn-dependent peptidase ImmA (M78 family)/transcriptional regulator with XRE-family HTH domain
MPKVSPTVLKWARESAGLSVDEAGKKLGLSPDRLEAFEAGGLEPSYRQLSNMSDNYRRPLITFYLPRPPKQADNGHDFRTLPQEDRQETDPLLHALLRDVQARHGLLKSALEDADDATPLRFVGSARMAEGVENVVASIRKVLGLSKEQFRQQRNVADAFGALRASAEAAGIYVLLMGNLGTHHTDIDVKAFRGFAIADPVAPFVIINEKDTRSAWSFTLLHELAHIWLGQTGISGYDSDDEVEKFCDLVAAKYLLDLSELEEFAERPADFVGLVSDIGTFAKQRNLSRGMVAYNLWRTGRISKEFYQRLVAEFDRDRAARVEAKPERDSGPNYYIVRRHRLGRALVSATNRLIRSGTLSTTKAGVVLGVKPTSVNRLVGQSA